jgi:glutamate synthase (NADPH/NADH) large chain
MTGGVVVVLGHTGRNFAAGMSGGIAYVYDPDGRFETLCNRDMVDLEKVQASDADPEDPRAPKQRAPGASDSGMGDMLRFDVERLRILIERHQLYTGSARARDILDNWDAALPHFIKVMPKDYRRALLEMEAERQGAVTVAAE